MLIPVAFWALYSEGWPLLVLMGICFVLVAYEWAMLIPKMSCVKEKIGFSLIGLVYVPFAFYCYLLLSQFEYKFHLIVIILIWASDIAAYFTGKIVGGPKLLPAFSPNKTWAGGVGAVLGPVLFMLAIYSWVFPPLGDQANPYSMLLMAGLAALIGVSGQVGDLSVSYLKRKAKVKDTGTLLPGHGGVLDRLDSLLLASVVVASAMFWVNV